jgi:flotillin
MLFWHVPAPNEALLISGSKRHKDATQFRIVTGHGSFVMPVKQKARVLSLALREAEITEECITNQGIRINVRAVAMKAQFERDMAIKQAGYVAETEEAKSRAAQAGPLAQAQASQEVIQQQTVLAQRQAELAAQKLEAEVRRPADAEAYRKRTLAEADRDQARFTTEAEAFRKRTMAEADRDQARLAAEAEAYRNTTLAEAEAGAARVRAEAAAHVERTTAQGEADANAARAASLREGNQELIAANKLIEMLPSLVDAAARGLADSNLTILNGTEGVNQAITGIVAQGLSILDVLRKAPAISGNGSAVDTMPPATSPSAGIDGRRAS